MSEYSNELWNQYTDDNENKLQIDLSQFIYNTCITLDTKRICEAGCNIGNNLSSFDENFEVYGYPGSQKPYNSMFDVQKQLPIYTKTTKSKSLFCAGYFIIHFDKGWVKSFCPKLVTLEKYEHGGPFKTELEMRQELSRANR